MHKNLGKEETMKTKNQTLWYTKPAKDFTQALPLGNGHLGAMVYGGFPRERISLNLDTLWSGGPGHWRGQQKIPQEMLGESRRLLKDGAYWDAQKLIQEHMLGCNNESYLSAGWLELQFGPDAKYDACDRRLHLDEAVTRTVWEFKGQKVREEVFVSAVQNGMYIRIHTEGSPLTVTVSLHTPLKVRKNEAKTQGLLLLAQAPSHVEPNYVSSSDPIQYDEEKPGMIYGLFIGVNECDGLIREKEGEICIQDFTCLTLFLSGKTGYEGYGSPLCTQDELLVHCLEERWEQAKLASYKEHFREHTREHQRLYLRTVLELEGGEEAEQRPTDERLRMVRNGGIDPGLSVLLFHYGRYLMLSSSRPLDALVQPANLQGIWCEDVRSVWSSNWTVNINTQMNYWICGPGNLPECEIPLVQMIKELADAGQEAAANLNCRGFAVHHNIDLWRQCIPALGEVKWAYWPMGGLWLTTHLYRHYLYTGDPEFLAEIYPVYQACAAFILDYVYQEEGGYQSCPSTSPENTFYDDQGRECAACVSSTMDIVLIREVLSNLLEIEKILRGKQPDSRQCQEAGNVLNALPEFHTGSKGQLLEWREEYREVDPGHRHFAHLIGFHPFNQINSEDTPGLVEAVKKSLEIRLKGRKQYIGWNCAWLINFSARLKEPDSAWEYVEQMLKYSVYDNLFDLHPPLGENEGEREIFQIDGNLGAAAGMTEFLVQCLGGKIYLLPALPKAWKSGRVKGIGAPGSLKISMEWEEGALTGGGLCAGKDGRAVIVCSVPFTIRGEKDSTLVYAMPGRAGWEAEIELKAGAKYSIARKDI